MMSLYASERRLFLLDGMALVYRAHYALIRSPRYTAAGACTSAVFGLATSLFDLLEREQPTHIAVAFDTAEPTHRHRVFPAYKAQRDAVPEDLAAQLPLVDRLFHALRIPAIRQPGFEADDIIGTLAEHAEHEGFSTWMVSPDKDLAQLVTPHTFVYKPGRKGAQFELLGVPEVLARWNITRVDQVVDILGLMGDASDNIPGVPGIGEKTAQKLIASYGSLENLLQHSDQLSGRVRQLLQDYRQQALASKQLVTIDRQVPLEIDWDILQRQPLCRPELEALFTECEFETLGKRVLGATFSITPAAAAPSHPRSPHPVQARLFAEPATEKTIRDVTHDYQIVQTAAQRAALIRQLKRVPAVCLDLETTGLDARTAEPLGIAFAWKPQAAAYVNCQPDGVSPTRLLEEFRAIFEDSAIEKIGHNLKYDLTVLRWHGFEIRGPVFDTMLAHVVLEPEMRHGMDYLAQHYLGYRPIPTSDLLGPKGPEQKNMRDVPLERVAEYACEDADVTLQLSQQLRPRLADQNLTRVCQEIECPLVRVLVDMEHAGIALDTRALAEYAARLQAEVESLRERIFVACGRRFNIDSPKQLGGVLFEELRLEDQPKKTPTGQYSTREQELLRLAARHPVVADVLEYRNAMKLQSTYVEQLPAAVDARTGRIHTHYHQLWTATGRMQSSDPNLQTIPIRKTRGREIRAAFVPRSEDYLILSADYSQIELRIMAELSRDEGLLQAFQEGLDIHAATAARMYKVELADVTRTMRDKAKTVNFGIIYGISAFGLQQRLNIPRAEAADLIATYFEKYPGVRSYIDQTVAFARQHGYVLTQTGRRRYLRDINSANQGLQSAAERLAMNSPIQGTAADLLKLAMIRVHQLLQASAFRTKMLLTVHDEIVFDLHKEEQRDVLPMIRDAMQSAMEMSVPIVVDMGVGGNWLEAH